MKKFTIKSIVFGLFLFNFLLITAIDSAAAEKKTIGVIIIPNIQYFEEMHKAFKETLTSEGITADKFQLITLSPLPEPISLMNTVRKFAAIETNIIVSYGAPAAISSVKEQSDIPVVFAGVFNHTAVGISLKNATGINSIVPISTLIKKLLSIKKSGSAGSSHIPKLGVVYSDSEEDTVIQTDEIKRLEKELGFRSVKFNIKKPIDTKKIVDIDAIILTTSCPATYCINNIIDIARKAKIPTGALMGGEEEKGVILTMAANPQEQGREAAKLVAKVLNGAKASSLSVKRPRKVDLMASGVSSFSRLMTLSILSSSMVFKP